MKRDPMETVGRMEGHRLITIEHGMPNQDVMALQMSLALHAWLKSHDKESRAVDFVNPWKSDKQLQRDAMNEWLGDSGPDSATVRFANFKDRVAEQSNDASSPAMQIDIADSNARELLLERIRATLH